MIHVNGNKQTEGGNVLKSGLLASRNMQMTGSLTCVYRLLPWEQILTADSCWRPCNRR